MKNQKIDYFKLPKQYNSLRIIQTISLKAYCRLQMMLEEKNLQIEC